MTKNKKDIIVESVICGWCDGTGEDKGKKCPLCLGKGRRLASDKGDNARYNKVMGVKKAPSSKAKKSEPTMKDLLAEAKELGLKNYSKLNKTDLAEVISEAKADKKESGKEEEAKGKTSKKK